MSQKKKRNIIIGTLCGVLLLMVIGYAAFNSVLKIKGTSNINSNWDVKITDIKKVSSKGSTDVDGTPKYDNLSATFNTNFTTPGDYATYKIEITNNGSMDAVLKTITMPENTNNDILFYLNKDQNNTNIANSLKQNDTLFKKGETGNVGYVYVTVLYKDYENQKTATTKTQSITITFDFEQAEGNVVTPQTQTVYSKNVSTIADEPGKYYISLGDSIEKINGYTEDYTTLNSKYFLKHILANEKVGSNEVCFVKDSTLHCLKPNEYETSKAALTNIFGESLCYVSDSSIACYDGFVGTYVTSDGDVIVGNGSLDSSATYGDIGGGIVATEQCYVYDNNRAQCREI